MRFLNRTAIVIPILIILIGIFSGLLYRSLTKKVDSGDNPVIGILTFKVRTIQRKYDNQVVWESITSSTEIKNKDTIRSEALSDAILTLEDGTEIQIGENSMILVDFSDKKWNLNFAYGTVAAKGTQEGGAGLNIKSGDSVIEVGKGELSLNKTGDNLSLSVTSGEAKFRRGEKEETLKENQSARITEDSMSIKNQAYRLNTPIDGSTLVVDSLEKKIDFSWDKTLATATNSRFELATDLGFRRKVHSKSIQSMSYSLPLKPGAYYWRLAYKNVAGKEEYSTVSRFNLLKKEEIRIFTPSNGSEISLSDGASRIPIIFSWSKAEIVGSYRVEISDTSSFSNILLSKDTTSTSIALSDLQKGKYFVRIVGKPFLPNESDILSPVSDFSIQSKTSLDTPRPMEPNNNKTLTIANLQESGVLFSWKDQPEYSSYRIQVSANADLENAVIDQTINQNFYRWKTSYTLGKYYWKVTGIAKSGESKESEIFQFSLTNTAQITLLRPAKGSKQEYIDSGVVSFFWKPIPVSGKLTLDISKSTNFEQKIISETVSGTSHSIKLPSPGQYFWRLIWASGEIQSASEVFSFNAESSLGSPKIIFPTNNSTVDMTTRESLNFSWSKVSEADLYQIVLQETTGIREREVMNLKLRDTRYELRDLTKLSQGRFRFEVRSIKKNMDGSFMESPMDRADFFITLTTGVSTKILTPGRVYVE
jgi:hypothetical protein